MCFLWKCNHALIPLSSSVLLLLLQHFPTYLTAQWCYMDIGCQNTFDGEKHTYPRMTIKCFKMLLRTILGLSSCRLHEVQHFRSVQRAISSLKMLFGKKHGLVWVRREVAWKGSICSFHLLVKGIGRHNLFSFGEKRQWKAKIHFILKWFLISPCKFRNSWLVRLTLSNTHVVFKREVCKNLF